MKSKFSILFTVLLTFSCNKLNREQPVDKEKIRGYDYRLFQNTHAWEIAKAVWDDDHSEIKQLISKDKNLINARDPRLGHTLLMFTIWHEQYNTFKLLLEQGADPNLYDDYNGRSAIIEACGIQNINPEYIKDLLQYGAKVNDIEIGKRREGNSTRNTPLIAAAREGNLPAVKLLVDSGADINFKNEYYQSALSYAATFENYDLISYLLDKSVDYKMILNYNAEQNKNYCLVDELRFYLPELGSSEHKKKKKIIAFLKNKGIDYDKVQIPEFIVEKAREKYPDTWKEYLKNY